jgi:oxygen-independent coproporphyrinogen-3 oxidase
MKQSLLANDGTPILPWQVAGFGLYVHWPFCQAKCPYCDFNSHVAGPQDEKAWAKAFVSELRRYNALTEGRTLSTIFFGGGTPSLMSASLVEEIISTACTLWTPANDIEVTLEANPSSVEAQKFMDFRLAGVNRVSLGVQSLRDDDLRRLGRLHDADAARRAIFVAAKTFDRFSFDLIYARQDQTEEEWTEELSEAIGFGADHLSLYQLTIEDGTAFGDRFARGTLRGLPDEDRSVQLYEITQAITRQNGLFAYEISNHARPGQEARHNLVYWRSGDYVGVGPGAHGRLSLSPDRRLATSGKRNPSLWLQAALTGNAEERSDVLSRLEFAEECILMGLRLAEGIDLRRLEAETGYTLGRQSLAELAEMQLVAATEETVRITERGRILLDSVLGALALEPRSGPKG